MGKENEGMPKYRKRVPIKPRVGPNGDSTAWTFASWCEPGFPKPSDVSENGYAVVTLRGAEGETTVVCRGLANEGNESNNLITRLREGNLISHSASVTQIFLCHDLVWESLSPAKASFRSGDSLVLVVREPRPIKRPLSKKAPPKAIRKVRFY